MKYILLLASVLFCVSVEAQTKKEPLKQEVKNDSIKHCPVNEFQISIIQEIEVKIEALNKERNKAIELITGVKIEDIEKLDFQPGEFVVKVKKKNTVLK